MNANVEGDRGLNRQLFANFMSPGGQTAFK